MKPLDEKDMKKIYVIPYCHTDYAWTNLRDWHIARYLESYCRALDCMEANPEYTFVLDNIVHSLQPFLRYCPERTEQLKKWARRGNVDICPGGWSLARPNQVGAETFVRNLAAADEAFRALLGEDIPITTYFNADTAMGHGQLPQLVRLMGYKNYQFQRPETFLDRKGYPRQFRWRGIDGSEILCAHSFYGGFSEAPYAKPDCRESWEKRRAGYAAEELSMRLKNQTNGCIQQFQGIDDMLPMTNRVDEPIDLEGFLRDWNANEPVPMVFSTLSGYFEALEREPLETLEGTVEPHEVLYNAPGRGEGSLWRLRKAMEARLLLLESVSAILEANGGCGISDAERKAAWEGLFAITGHAMESIYSADWERMYNAAKGQYLTEGEQIRAMLESLADLVGCGGEDEHVLVNPTGSTVTAAVRLTVTNATGLRKLNLTDENGNAVPWQLTDISNGDKAYTPFCYSAMEIAALVTLPPFGVRILRESWTGETMQWLPDGEKCRLYHDLGAGRVYEPEGTVSAGSVTAAFHGMELTENGLPALRLRFTETKARNDWLFDYEPVTEEYFLPKKGYFTLRGPLAWMYRAEGTLTGCPCTVTYTIGEMPGAIKVDVEVEGRGRNGYYAVDFPADCGTPLTVDMPFGWEKRDPDALWSVDTKDEYEVCLPGQFWATSWVSFEKDGMPKSVISKNCSVYWRWNREKACVTLMLTRACGEPEKPYGRLDAWKYGENKADRLTGTQHFTFYLSSENNPAALCRMSDAIRKPILVGRSWLHVEKQPVAPLFVPMEGAQVTVTALYSEAGAILVRLCECAGEGGTLKAKVCADRRSAEKTDFRGRKLESLSLEHGLLSVPLRPFEIVTLRIV